MAEAGREPGSDALLCTAELRSLLQTHSHMAKRGKAWQETVPRAVEGRATGQG